MESAQNAPKALIATVRRVYFCCRSCGLTSWRAYKLDASWARNEFVCPRCGSISHVRHLALLDVFLGVIVAGYVLAISAWIDTQLPDTSSPYISVLAAIALSIPLAVATLMIYSRIFYRWRVRSSERE